jgi:rubredoxin
VINGTGSRRSSGKISSTSIRNFLGGVALAIEVTGGIVVNERGTVVTYRQKCERCGYVYDYNKTTIVPAYSTRSARNFTCPECGNYQEVSLKHYNPTRQ